MEDVEKPKNAKQNVRDKLYNYLKIVLLINYIMGIIINDVFEDPRGFTSNQTYASFANLRMCITKNACTQYYVDISQEDASGNPNATSYEKEIVDGSGNKTIDASGYILSETLYKERRTRCLYGVSCNLFRYKDKQSRLDGKSPVHKYHVNISIEITDFGNIFSKLYEKIKTDKNLFPFNNITDDL